MVDFARGRKLDLARLRAIQQQAAAYETGTERRRPSPGRGARDNP